MAWKDLTASGIGGGTYSFFYPPMGYNNLYPTGILYDSGIEMPGGIITYIDYFVMPPRTGTVDFYIIVETSSAGGAISGFFGLQQLAWGVTDSIGPALYNDTITIAQATFYQFKKVGRYSVAAGDLMRVQFNKSTGGPAYYVGNVLVYV
jgi:hypothetical protein